MIDDPVSDSRGDSMLQENNAAMSVRTRMSLLKIYISKDPEAVLLDMAFSTTVGILCEIPVVVCVVDRSIRMILRQIQASTRAVIRFNLTVICPSDTIIVEMRRLVDYSLALRRHRSGAHVWARGACSHCRLYRAPTAGIILYRE